jgi:hypothetical protein
MAMQQLMLPLLLAMDATKKGLLAFVQQMGMAVLSELLATESAMLAAVSAEMSRRLPSERQASERRTISPPSRGRRPG